MERKKKILTEFERRRVHVPEEAKVKLVRGVVGDELSCAQGASSGKCRDSHSQDFEEALLHGVHQDPDQIQRFRLFWVTEIMQR